MTDLLDDALAHKKFNPTGCKSAAQNEVARQGPWSRYLDDAGYARGLLPVEGYYDIIRPLVASLDIWVTTYLHVLTGENAVTEWAAGDHPGIK